MNSVEAINLVRDALSTATGKKSVEVNKDLHLVDSGMLDSLDASVFLLELEKASGRKITDQEVESHNLYQVSNMVEWLCR